MPEWWTLERVCGEMEKQDVKAGSDPRTVRKVMQQCQGRNLCGSWSCGAQHDINSPGDGDKLSCQLGKPPVVQRGPMCATRRGCSRILSGRERGLHSASPFTLHLLSALYPTRVFELIWGMICKLLRLSKYCEKVFAWNVTHEAEATSVVYKRLKSTASLGWIFK